MRTLLPLAVGLACVWVVLSRLNDVAFGTVWAATQSVAVWQWGVAGLATVVSYLALARYDVQAHALCRTGVGPRAAMRAGLCGIAVSQTIGLGIVSGSVVRWKLLPSVTVAQAAMITATVSGMFVLSWAVLVMGSAVWAHVGTLPAAPALPMGWAAQWMIPVIVVCCLGLIALSLWRPAIAGRPMPLPSVMQMTQMMGLAALDLGGAALAFWALLPDAGISVAQVAPVIILALGLGLFSGTPGGMGPFELTLLAGLPQVPVPDLLAAILCYRIVYFALPAVIAGGWLLRDHLTHRPRPLRLPPPVVPHARPRAETALVAQNGGTILTLGPTAWAVADTGQTLTALFDPLAGPQAEALARLHHQARLSGRIPLVYKAGRHMALTARRAGWRVAHLCDDAYITTAAFDLSHRCHRQLRRKLRHAAKAGVTVRPMAAATDLASLGAIADIWRKNHGGERGLTMGRFSPRALSGQMVLVAECQSRPIAFVSFHVTPDEVCLDLMRHGPNLPDGVMHALIVAGIEAARDQGMALLCLAAAPRPPQDDAPWALRLAQRRIWAASGGAGLRQFKTSFAPVWRPRFAAAPGRISLALGLLDVARAVHHPDNIAPEPRAIAPS
ncbi:MAG: phosphatidylglycerol lysyltransferase domain-containing protein [Paracoccaceae bacterium]